MPLERKHVPPIDLPFDVNPTGIQPQQEKPQADLSSLLSGWTMSPVLNPPNDSPTSADQTPSTDKPQPE